MTFRVVDREVCCGSFLPCVVESGLFPQPYERKYDVLAPSVSSQAVQSVNMSHDTAHAQMDVKFRSLACVGLK